MKTTYDWKGCAACAALLLGSLAGCDFIEPTSTNPNNVANASADQLFTGIQVNTFYLSESIYARVGSMWTQQTAGVTSQFTALDEYQINEDDTDDEMAAHYIGGGLIDIRKAIAQTDEAGRRVYSGILKIHEVYLMGLAASIYGDIPYSQAIDETVTEPALDPQLEVYAALQAKLDEAIADIESGADPTGAEVPDLNFGGDPVRWLAVAYSLKARYYLHTAEVDPGAYAQALAAAQNGIAEAAGNWRAIHSSTATETNIWHQFTRDRPDHIVGGYYLVNLLNGGTPADFSDDDPRLAIYFLTARGDLAGQYIGSKPGTEAGDIAQEEASPLNTETGGAAAPDYDQPILTCSETQFIIAEAAYQGGDEAAARDAVNRGIACQEAAHGVSLSDIDPGLSGEALLAEIIRQKYMALFLNAEVWNDYKRTCLPAIATFEGADIPGRLLYGTTERTTNGNIPDVGQQRQNPRNANDPNPC